MHQDGPEEGLQLVSDEQMRDAVRRLLATTVTTCISHKALQQTELSGKAVQNFQHFDTSSTCSDASKGKAKIFKMIFVY